MRICVMGCGPAGAITALGLNNLGYSVSLVGEIRPYPVTEGVSARVCRALADHGLQRGLAKVSKPVKRLALWNGQQRDANTECLVFRPEFDRAMLEDLVERGIDYRSGRVRNVTREDAGWSVDIDSASGRLSIEADYLVEARGRAAGYAGKDRQRGPETVSVGMNWSTQPASAFTAVASVQDGWLWLARFDDGRLFSQFTTHAKHHRLTPKDNIPALIDEKITRAELPHLGIERRRQTGEPMARSSTAILPAEPSAPGLLRVGDAAMAVDPLSGNGIFQSLSSALAAPAVINTVLKRPESAGLALEFYRERLHHLFFRFARIGRDFYSQESRWSGCDFWSERARWPDSEPAHADNDEIIGRAQRPVIHHGFIEEREVVMTKGQPLGAAHVISGETPDP